MGQVDLARGDAELGADVAHLGIENPVGVKHALCRPRAAGGKQDGGDFIGLRVGHAVGLPVLAAHLAQGDPAPEPSPAHGDKGVDAFEIGGCQGAQHVGRGDADQGAGPALFQAVQHPGNTHARVHHHGHGPDLEQGKNEGEKIQAGLDHQDGAHTAADARTVKPLCQAVRLDIQLAKRKVGVCHAAFTVPAAWADHCPFVGLDARHAAQVGGHVDDVAGGLFRCWFHSKTPLFITRIVRNH